MMVDLAFHDLIVRICNPNQQEEQHLELRIASTGDFVAWFQTAMRLSAGEQVISTNSQIVRRTMLSDEQLNAAQEWLREQVLAVI